MNYIIISWIHIKNPLSFEFLDRSADEVARDLLGKLIIHQSDFGLQISRIVETEAYMGPEDLAAHSSKGVTPRTQVLYGPAGFWYVYLIYGIYHLLNVVTGPAGSAVLIRAVEPIQGINTKTNGPGLVCKSMGIDKNYNLLSALEGKLYLADDGFEVNEKEIVATKRVGIDYAGDFWKNLPLRFYINGNQFVSKK